MPIHKHAWREFCARKNIVLTDDDFRNKVSGLRNDQICKNLFGDDISDEDIEAYAAEKEAVYREIYKPYIKEVPGLTNVLERLKEKNLKLAIATTAPKENRKFVLEALNMQDSFDIILGEEDVQKGKPNPEIYLKTAGLLKVDPTTCLVFEDSPVGVASAKNAGMTVVGITTSHSAEELKDADIIIEDFTELELV
ncbi:MAG: HAD-superfamily hydrolase, subfamily IA, variant 3 [Candidatus Magasanikbacteria bacterium GW2011_GWD2_43_18]|uniref:HAD-superfamily hydrolase, subfamily IA, variant 3 n=1 Tax=Candidatus Magasanikbacteria bacterium GW2011_GWE2_42_7 TaxID=1619052 RepID=A0A0G1DPI1_9BACT|nr:MAG: HAD-superfamily hydrolase, subfamily IA, variant 3 [Candidatus Magasanikbacteria bacterium GW2011_GWC2_42_27]KKS72721.1 MAG: HAD-superfamily hydrolase, subfamily IA, variant 3 [Candidatus Magasanikbacteria bacterium GW2011_GWE2_42_7]KKT05050.1 MAG: HAD-superfamily hydrolase, subfamily IA, variant 3 [Candidatus Magasanikbacteria bacterium GW2011_GWD2_43_18]KKT24767.1 MAG: HAD-superfamily hydrolase, subfamily IA, variant 3 [Candidatus Magasanikbacteria bacterium GW2011_GWA2_43_9]